MLSEAADPKSMVRKYDVESVAEYMMQLRRTGLTPSDVVQRGLDYSDRYVLDEFGDITPRARMKLSAELWEQAAIVVGVHAGQRREQKQAQQK